VSIEPVSEGGDPTYYQVDQADALRGNEPSEGLRAFVEGLGERELATAIAIGEFRDELVKD
jgi:hypothetical protein